MLCVLCTHTRMHSMIQYCWIDTILSGNVAVCQQKQGRRGLANKHEYKYVCCIFLKKIAMSNVL